MPFPTTQWSLLAQATLHGDSAAGEALGEFYQRYREPLVGFIARQPAQRERAEDLAHEFFLALMHNSTLRRADRSRGRFRSFLLAVLVRFLARDRARASAEKRGAGTAPVSLDDFGEDSGDFAVPPAVAQAFDREWGHGLMLNARRDVETAWRERGLSAEFSTLANFLPGATATPAYETAAAQLDWPLARLKTEVFRLRQQFRESLRAAVALTVESPDQVDAEMKHLHAVLSDAST